MQEGSEKSALTSGNYFEAGKKNGASHRGQIQGQMTAGFVEAMMADAGRKEASVAQWHCPDALAVQRTNWEDSGV